LFIDKPLAATLEDAREIARLAKQAGAPWFSSSSLRYGEIGATMKFADATGATTWGPGPFEPHHYLDLSWYAIHPVELLYALLGPGCESVTRPARSESDVLERAWFGRMGERYVTASELKSFAFCRRAWLLERQGIESAGTRRD
jgi:predicted dehydrogenase